MMSTAEKAVFQNVAQMLAMPGGIDENPSESA